MKIKLVGKHCFALLKNLETLAGSQAKLLDGVSARGQLCCKDAQHADHGHAAIVELLGPHLGSVQPVYLQAKDVAKVARFLLWVIRPYLLQESTSGNECDEAHDAFTCDHCAEGT